MEYYSDKDYADIAVNMNRQMIEDLEDKVNLLAIQVDKLQKQMARMVEYK